MSAQSQLVHIIDTKIYTNGELKAAVFNPLMKQVVQYVADVGNGEQQILDESLIGSMDGVNAQFVIQNPLIPDTEKLYSNGIRLHKPDDYIISGQNIQLSFSPSSNEKLSVDYIKVM